MTTPRRAKKAAPAPKANPLRAPLLGLGVALAETARRYVDRLQREIAEVVDTLPEPGRGGRIDKRRLDKIGKLLAGLQVKPHKGRRKDLKKIDLLIGEIQQIIGD